MLIQSHRVINTCGFGPENTSSVCRLLPSHRPVTPWFLHSQRVHGLGGVVFKASRRELCGCVKGLVTDVRQPNSLLATTATNKQKSLHGVCVCVCVCVCVRVCVCVCVTCYVNKLILFESSGYEPLIVTLWQF